MKSTALRLRGPQLEHLVLHQLARLDVERRERLVHQDDVGVEHQRLRQADALAHAARELVRVAVAEAAEADALAASPRPARAASAAPRNSSPAVTLSQRGAPRHQALGLEHVAGAPVDARRAARRTPRRVPVLGASRPAATLSSVLLPQPVGPTTETNSPAPTVSVDVAHRGVALAGSSLVDEGAGDAVDRAPAPAPAAAHVGAACVASPSGTWRWRASTNSLV